MYIECIGDINLKDVNAQYRLLFDCALDTIVLIDFHGKIWIEDRVPGDYTKGARFVVLLPVVGDSNSS
jgi:hypothetical protein